MPAHRATFGHIQVIHWSAQVHCSIILNQLEPYGPRDRESSQLWYAERNGLSENLKLSIIRLSGTVNVGAER